MGALARQLDFPRRIEGSDECVFALLTSPWCRLLLQAGAVNKQGDSILCR